MPRSGSQVMLYAETLAKGRAITVRRVAQYADYDVESLRDALQKWGYWQSDTPYPLWNGVNIALTRALADAEDRQYRQRH